MTRPTDAAIARAFWEVLADEMDPYDAPDFSRFLRKIKIHAERFDAESPAGTADEICDCGYVRGSFGCDDAHKNTRKVTTSMERVQIPAESKHVQCPKCPAHMPVGKWCGGAQCPLRK